MAIPSGSGSTQPPLSNPMMPGAFTNAGIPWLDTAVYYIPPPPGNMPVGYVSMYVKVIDAVFMAAGGAALAYGLYKGSLAADIAGAVLILMGILGVAIGWD